MSVSGFYAQCSRNGIDVHKLHAAQLRKPVQSEQLQTLIEQINESYDGLLSRILLDLLKQDCSLIRFSVTKKDRTVVRNITRVACAVLLDIKPLVKVLVKSGCHPNDVDTQGFTALHFAAMTDRFAHLELLVALGGSLLQTTRQGLSVFDIIKARGYECEQTRRITVHKNEQVPICEMARAINRLYLENNIYSTDALIIEWKSKVSDTKTNRFYAPYKRIKQSQRPFEPPVYIQKIAPGSPLEGQYELKAKRVIAAGEIILEYTGYVDDRLNCRSQYCMDATDVLTIDAELQGTFAELANHSFPNAACFPIAYKGLRRCLIIALTTIAADSSIHLDYGISYFAKSRFKPVELVPKTIEDFCRDSKNLTDFSAIMQRYFPWQQPIAQEYLASCAEYFYEFPDALLNLVEQGKMPLQNVAEFFEKFNDTGQPEEIGIEDPEEHYEMLLSKIEDLQLKHD